MSTKMQVDWRRTKVLELLSKGDSQSDIAKSLQVDLSIISRDVYFLRQQAKENIKKYIDERLPEEYEKCLVGLTAILREAWTTSQQAKDRREKMQALSLVKECYSMKLHLLTNATVVDDAIRFVKSNLYQQQQSEKEEDQDHEHHDEDDYEDHDEDKEEKETGEMTQTATNQVF